MAARNDELLTDGDAGFAGVADRVHPAELPAGFLAGGLNVTMEFGDVRHRWAAVQEAWGHSWNLYGEPLACARWWEPESGEEALVVMTDGVRSDGGRGRAWQVSPGSVPVEIPMNGHDVWSACRLAATPTALVLTRIGNARHYFKETAIHKDTDNYIQLNCTPELVDGERVYLGVVGDITPQIEPLQNNTQYWVTVESGNKIKFYSDPACAGGDLILLEEFTGTGQWYVERAAFNPPIGGIGALPLLMEASAAGSGSTNAFGVGFGSVPQVVDASIQTGSRLWSAPNHRFSAGQAVKVGVAVAGFTTTLVYYAEPAGAHALYLHDSAVTAMLSDIDPLTGALYSPDKRLAAGGTSSSNFLAAADYSGMPIVPLTEIIHYKNRLIGLNGRSNLAISDPGDPLHFTPYTGALSAFLGNGDPLTALFSLGRDNLVLSTSTNLLAVTGLDQSQGSWRLIELSREFGCIAPLSIAQSGAKARFLSRSGVVLAQLDGASEPEIVEVPMSAGIQRKFSEIDWGAAHIACGAYFDNRYLLAVPLKGQEVGAEVNNCIFVWNFLTGQWDGWWTGASLTPVQFTRLKVGGEEVLCFLNSSGHVFYFDPDGHQDLAQETADGETFTSAPAEIEMRATLRGYTCGTPHFKEWLAAYLVVDTLNAKWSLSSISEGVNVTRTYRSDQTQDHTKFFKHGVADYHPLTEPTRAALPYREDYSANPLGPNMVPAGSVWLKTNPVPSLGISLAAGDYYWTPGNATTLEHSGGTVIAPPAKSFYHKGGTLTLYCTDVSLLGLPVTDLVQEEGITLPADGLYAEPHQTMNEPLRIPLHDRSRSLQFEFANTQGSARLRSIALEANRATRP